MAIWLSLLFISAAWTASVYPNRRIKEERGKLNIRRAFISAAMIAISIVIYVGINLKTNNMIGQAFEMFILIEVFAVLWAMSIYAISPKKPMKEDVRILNPNDQDVQEAKNMAKSQRKIYRGIKFNRVYLLKAKYFGLVNLFIFAFLFGIFLFGNLPTVHDPITKARQVIQENITTVKVEAFPNLPLSPKGKEIVVIDTSKGSKISVDEFYLENVEFFTQRKEATYIFSNEVLTNFTGIDLSTIDYSYEIQNSNTLLESISKVPGETVWLFSQILDLKDTNLKIAKNAIIYSPVEISIEKENILKKVFLSVKIVTIENLK